MLSFVSVDSAAVIIKVDKETV